MKKLYKYFVVLWSIILIAGCDKPDAIVLEPDIDNSDKVEIEVLSSDPESEISKGMDSTGTIEEYIRFTNYIAVSGIKITDNSVTTNISTAQAIFFDRTIPYFDLNNRLIGFRARSIGNVKFNDVNANLVPFKVRFKDRNGVRDTTLGFQHLLYKGRGNHSDPFDFIYNSSISFTLDPFLGNTVTFGIPTPHEITGTLSISRNSINNRLQALLTWNHFNEGKIEIIVGAKRRNLNSIIPLYRIKTPDDGSLVIPPGLINSIPPDLFNHFVISLVRKYEGYHESNGNQLFVRSQSVHSIAVEIP